MSYRDATIHVGLNAVLACGAAAVIAPAFAGPLSWSQFAYALVPGALLSSAPIFLREVTQVQAAHHGNSFFTGWDFWNRSLAHNAEWWLPASIVMPLSILTQTLF